MNQRQFNTLAKHHNALLRDPQEIINQKQMDVVTPPDLLKFKTQGPFWKILHDSGIRLMVSREYEHFVLMLGASKKEPEISYTPLAHPSGIAVDRRQGKVFIAASRNPNQVYTFCPIQGPLARRDVKLDRNTSVYGKKVLLPARADFYPGSLYIHDLAFIGSDLYANAVAHNAVIKLLPEGGYEYVWWPLGAQDRGKKPRRDRNYLQLNSISGGKKMRECFFTATTDKPGERRIGDPKFKVDGKGVVFSGKTRKPICVGLTRPHSARLYQGKIWLDNSGYGEFGFVEKGEFVPIVRLPGWTRGLCFHKDLAFVGVSRVLPRFANYAPGLDQKKCLCGIFVIDLKSPKVVAHIRWPYGNQIFSVEWIKAGFSTGFVNMFRPLKNEINTNHLFYSYK